MNAKVFVAVSYGRDNETAVCGVSGSRDGARRLTELERNEILYWAREACDGPNGGAAVDDLRGDLVGRVLAFDTAVDSPHEECLLRMLNPEDLGMAVTAYVRDEIRDVLGMRRVEWEVRR